MKTPGLEHPFTKYVKGVLGKFRVMSRVTRSAKSQDLLRQLDSPKRAPRRKTLINKVILGKNEESNSDDVTPLGSPLASLPLDSSSECEWQLAGKKKASPTQRGNHSDFGNILSSVDSSPSVTSRLDDNGFSPLGIDDNFDEIPDKDICDAADECIEISRSSQSKKIQGKVRRSARVLNQCSESVIDPLIQQNIFMNSFSGRSTEEDFLTLASELEYGNDGKVYVDEDQYNLMNLIIPNDCGKSMQDLVDEGEKPMRARYLFISQMFKDLNSVWCKLLVNADLNGLKREYDAHSLPIVRDGIRKYLDSSNFIPNLLTAHTIRNPKPPSGKKSGGIGSKKTVKKKGAIKNTRRHDAIGMANMGRLKKACSLLLDEVPICIPSRAHVDAKFPKDPHRPIYKYDEEQDILTLHIEEEDIRSHIDNLRASSAKGASSFKNEDIKLLLRGSYADSNASGITFLVNAICRGWVSVKDWDLLNTSRGIALDKMKEVGDFRPICISEPLMALVDMHGLSQNRGPLLSCSGSNEGVQLGLTPNGIHELSCYLQLRSEKSLYSYLSTNSGNLNNMRKDNWGLGHFDLQNAFGSAFRVFFIRMIKEKKLCFQNYLNRLFGTDAKVSFGDLDAVMEVGTHQGRRSSPLLFDAMLYWFLDTNGVLDKLQELGMDLSLIHDDMFLEGNVVNMHTAFKLIRDSLRETNLQLNESKTELYVPWLTVPVDNSHKGIIEFILDDNLDRDRISQNGMIVGGVPVGNDIFILDYLRVKIEKYNVDLDKICSSVNGFDSGVTHGILKSCLSTRWNHLMRGISPYFWNQKFNSKLTFSEKIDDINLEYITSQCRLLKYRDDLDPQEKKLALLLMKLRVRNGGLGINSTSMNIAAWIGAWGAIGKKVLMKLGDLSHLESNTTHTSFAVAPSIDSVPSSPSTSIFNHLAALPTGRRTVDALDSLNSIGVILSVDQRKDVGFDTGKNSITNICKILYNEICNGLDHDIKRMGCGKLQHRIANVLMLGINNKCDQILCLKNGIRVDDPSKNDVLRAFVAAKDSCAGRFLFRSHLSEKSRHMNSHMLDTQILGRLMISVVRGKFRCQFCNKDIITFHSVHAEECNHVQVTDPITNKSSAHSVPNRRSHKIHSDLKGLFIKLVPLIPMASIHNKEPIMDEIFVNLGNDKQIAKKGKSPKKATEPINTNVDVHIGTPVAGIGNPSVPPVIVNPSKVDKRKRADLEIHYSDRFRQPCSVVVDVTCYSVHKISNLKNAKVTSGVANYGEGKKDDNYSDFDHNGDCISFGVDSAGGISDAARKFINDLYGKPKADEQSVWLTDKDRVTNKVRFIDSLSCILAKHRAKDIIRLGTKTLSKNFSHRVVYEGHNTPIEQAGF